MIPVFGLDSFLRIVPRFSLVSSFNTELNTCLAYLTAFLLLAVLAGDMSTMGQANSIESIAGSERTTDDQQRDNQSLERVPSRS